MIKRSLCRNIVYRILIVAIFFSLIVVTAKTSSLEEAILKQQTNTNESSKIPPNPTLPLLIAENNSSQANISISDLYNYLANLYSLEEGRFREKINGIATTIATQQAITILKLSGLQGYLIDTLAAEKLIYSEFFERLNVTDSGGYRIAFEADLPTVEGTFGVVMSLKLLGDHDSLQTIKQAVKIYLETTAYIYEPGSNMGGFKGPFGELSFQDTAMAMEIASMLGFQFNSNISNAVFNLVKDTWTANETQGYFKFSEESSALEDSFSAILALDSLNQTGNYLLDYKGKLSNWIKELQCDSGPFEGGFTEGEKNATVKSTGLALLTLRRLGESPFKPELSQNFFLRSQYLDEDSGADKGGFGINNFTFKDEFSYVSIDNTYYSILGLSTLDYFINNTQVSLETSVSRSDIYSTDNNEIIQGQPASVYLYFDLFDYKSFSKFTIDISISDWNITNEDEVVFLGKSQYQFDIQNDTANAFNWSLGEHVVTGSYQIVNFSLFEIPVKEIHSSVIVRLGVWSQLNRTGAVNPGSLLELDLYIYNTSVITFSDVNRTDGNVTIQARTSNNRIINLTEIQLNGSLLACNISIPENASLGDLKLLISYTSNQTPISFVEAYKEMLIVINSEIFLNGYSNQKSNDSSLTQYIGYNYSLNVTLAYSNGKFPDKINATAFFRSNATDQELFSTDVLSIPTVNNTFTLNSTDKIPAKFMSGNFNLTIKFAWNSSTSGIYLYKLARNNTLDVIPVSGKPILLNTTITPDREVFYYGEEINLTTKIGIVHELGTMTINESISFKSYLVNRTNEEEIFQTFLLDRIDNETFSSSQIVNPNLLAGDYYSILIKIKNIANNTYLKLFEESNLSLPWQYDFGVGGKLVIKDLALLTQTNSDNSQHYEHVLESGPFMLFTFQLYCEESDIWVKGTDLYANLTSNEEEINLPDVISSAQSSFYQLFIPVIELEAKEYTLSIFSKTAMTRDTLLLKIQILIIENHLQEEMSLAMENIFAGIGIASALFMVLVAYLLRPKEQLKK